MIKLVIKENILSQRVDKFLCAKFDISFALAQKLIRGGKIKINDQKIDATWRLSYGDQLTIYENLNLRIVKNHKKKISDEQMSNFQSWIIYEDDNLIAIDKPSGLATQGGSGIKISIDDFLTNKSWQLVHRLDKDTSGILLIAKNKEMADFLINKFRQRSISKTYLAIIKGKINKDQGTINIPLQKRNQGKNEKVMPDFENGKEAITNFEVIKRFADFTIIKLKPITGRTHQLRVHMKEMGHAIINDVKYGRKIVEDKKLSKRLCLHAYKIVIKDYFDDKNLVIKTNLPEFLVKFKQLKLDD